MNILLLGATGRVGKAVTAIILGNGHQLTILTRDKNKVNLQNHNLEVVEGDIYDWLLLKQLSKRDYDVIINVIGSAPKTPSTIVTDATVAITSLFNFAEKPVRYIALTTIAQIKKSLPGRITAALAKTTALKYIIADHQQAYETIKTSDFYWCLIACPRIVDGPAVGKFKTSFIFNGGAKEIHPGDVAVVIGNQLNKLFTEKVIGIWY